MYKLLAINKLKQLEIQNPHSEKKERKGQHLDQHEDDQIQEEERKKPMNQ